MIDQHSTTRRRLLVTTGSLASLGLAGCVSGAQRTIQAGQNAPDDSHTVEEDSHEERGTDHGSADPHRKTVEAHHGDAQAHGEGGHGLSGPRAYATVEMITNDSGYHFHPHVTWVEVGGTVTFENVSGAHSATAYHPDNERPLRIPEGATAFDSGLLSETGATFEHHFETEGVYDVYCAPHEELGMIGSVIVGEPDPHDQPGLATPEPAMTDPVTKKITSLNHTVNEALGHTHDEEESTSTDPTGHDQPDAGHHANGGETEATHHNGETEAGHHAGETESGHGH